MTPTPPPPPKTSPESYSALRERNRRADRRRLLLRAAIIAGAVIIALVIVLIAVSVFASVKEIVVVGNTQYSTEAILEIGGIKKGKILGGVSESKVRKRLRAAYDFIDDVKIKKSPSGKVTVTVKESASTFYIKIPGNAYVVVSAGLRVIEITEGIVPSTIERYGNIREVVLHEQITAIVGQKLAFPENPKHAERLTHVVANVEYSPMLRANAHRVDCDFFNLKMMYDDRIEIFFGTSSDLKDKIAFAEAILVDVNENGRGALYVYDASDAYIDLENPADYGK